MIKICKQNQKNIKEKILSNNIDNVSYSISSLADDIILSMHDHKILECLSHSIKDKRAHNTVIPFDLVLALSICAKMKTKTSFSDIPYAISDHRVLAKLGYNIVDRKGNLKNELMRESSLRFLIGKYSSEELFAAYNNTVQNFIMPTINVRPDIHILDCTDIPVNLKNSNYEGSEVVTKDKFGNTTRGYKLATLRGIVDDTGLIEEICFGAINIHDLELTRNMLYTTPLLKEGDILINDRGFMDRTLMNYLKRERGVDTYIPLRSNMIAYEMATSAAQYQNNWEKHPSRNNQKITFIKNLKDYWQSDNPEEDVDFNAAVVWDLDSDNYAVFITTDTSITAKQIVLTYELRPEVEEDYRQLKDFWNLSDFKSTKLNMIAFHIITTLFGYLFFQIYTMTPQGEAYSHKSLPVVLKNYSPNAMPYLIFYYDNEFAVLSITDFAKIYGECSEQIQKELDYIFSLP